jgi:hypothetical protein
MGLHAGPDRTCVPGAGEGAAAPHGKVLGQMATGGALHLNA